MTPATRAMQRTTAGPSPTRVQQAVTPAPVQEAPAAEVPVEAQVEDNASRLGFDPYAESNAHLEKAVQAEQAKPEFVSPLPATPVSELRAAIPTLRARLEAEIQ